MEKIDVIERAANGLLQHNVAEVRIAIELMQESHDQRLLIKSYLVPIFGSSSPCVKKKIT